MENPADDQGPGRSTAWWAAFAGNDGSTRKWAGDDGRCFGLVGAEIMTFQSIPEAILIGIAVVFSGALTFFAWRRRAMPLAPAFAIMMAGETVWALGAALEPIIVELP